MITTPEFSARWVASPEAIAKALNAEPDPRGWVALPARMTAVEHALLDHAHKTAWVCECGACKLTRRNTTWLAARAIFLCDSCGETKGCRLSGGVHRCNACGWPVGGLGSALAPLINATNPAAAYRALDVVYGAHEQVPGPPERQRRDP